MNEDDEGVRVVEESESDREDSGPFTRSRAHRPRRMGRLRFEEDLTPRIPSTPNTPISRLHKRKRIDENTPVTGSVDKAKGNIATKTRLKIQIHQVVVSAAWKWKDVTDDSCGICRSAFEACCVECKFPGDDCPLVSGACRHFFHAHCISSWSRQDEQAKTQCPLCRQEWKCVQ